MIRVYARIAGGALSLMGLLGLTDLMSTNLMTSFYYVVVGVLFLYLGFLQRDEGVVREMIGGLGVLLVSVMGGTIVAPLPWGEKPLLGSIEVTCLMLGIFSILAARYLPDRALRFGGFRKVMVRLKARMSYVDWREGSEAPEGQRAGNRTARSVQAD